ncbi:MAG: hypothetical protein JOZ33_06090 [Acidobacteriaceae bacterium]|nr:hypothetical protein [Acidobacteriaceae bacterium]
MRRALVAGASGVSGQHVVTLTVYKGGRSNSRATPKSAADPHLGRDADGGPRIEASILRAGVPRVSRRATTR